MDSLSHSVLDFEALWFFWVSWESLEIAVLSHFLPQSQLGNLLLCCAFCYWLTPLFDIYRISRGLSPFLPFFALGLGEADWIWEACEVEGWAGAAMGVCWLFFAMSLMSIVLPSREYQSILLGLTHDPFMLIVRELREMAWCRGVGFIVVNTHVSLYLYPALARARSHLFHANLNKQTLYWLTSQIKISYYLLHRT